MKTFREYHELYNKTDVLLLADVFENFRDVCLENYGLDPTWYYTSSGLSWDAMLKCTKIELEFKRDHDMLLFIKKGIRGGISMVSNRYAKANNSYMGEKFDRSKPSSCIMYYDANNLYGWAMSQKLPIHGFKWMSNEDLEGWRNIPCMLEVDLRYCDEFHDLHNDYPLAPEHVKVNKVIKLIPNLNDKEKYVVHSEILKLYKSLGLEITKIHRGLRFEESNWTKQYIEMNTTLRKEAKSEFEKNVFKLMNNSVFGKTMENIDKRVDIRLATNKEVALKLAARPNYNSLTFFHKNLIALHMKKTKVYLGLCILDISKSLMYNFHYNHIKKKYKDKAKLLFTDTDSLIYHIETEDVYADIRHDVDKWFDTSDYKEDHPSRIRTEINKKATGKFKDEVCGQQIEEVVALCPKSYSIKMYEDGKEENKKASIR